MESLNNGRAKIRPTMNGTQISIPSKKNWFLLLFGTVWLGGWATALVSVSTIFNTEILSMDWFIVFWIIGWTFGGLGVITLLLWGYFGRENLSIQNRRVFFKKHILGLGRSRELDKRAVKNVRFQKVETSLFQSRSTLALWGWGEGKILFDYGMKTFSLGLSLDDAEANHIVALLEEELAA